MKEIWDGKLFFPIKRDTEEIWKENLLRVDCGWEIREEGQPASGDADRRKYRCAAAFPIGMVQIVIVCLSCFDANKKIYIYQHK